MRIPANRVLTGDRVRGLGLVVTDVVPETDFSTRITGTVSHRTDEAAGYDGSEFVETEVLIVLPNVHQVNVAVTDETFKAHRVQWTQDLIGSLDEQLSDGSGVSEFVSSLVRIADAPRGRTVDYAAVEAYVVAMSGTESAEDIVDALDALPEKESDMEFAGESYLG